MKKLSDYQESLERYKKYFPKNCVGKTDIEILLYRKVISENEAQLLNNPIIPEQPKIKRPKIMTKKQFLKKCQDIYSDYHNNNPDEDFADVAYDIAASLLYFDTEGFADYLNNQGINPKHHKEALAEYIHG